METPHTSALEAARQQLEYWKQQRIVAARRAEPERLVQCDKFIAQCELVISALESTRERNGGTAPTFRSSGDA